METETATPTPAGPATPPPPDFRTALSVVADRIKSLREIALGVLAIVSAGFAAWVYFASEAELTKTRCLIHAHITVTAYQDKVNLYELAIDTKTRIKNAIASELQRLPKSTKIEQLNKISSLDREIENFSKARTDADAEYKAAQSKIDSDTCAEKTAKASEGEGKK
jgi:hypothetical protein